MGKYEGVFWVTAKSKEAVATRYHEFDELVKKASDKTFFEWSIEHHWLLILDSLEDPVVYNGFEMIPHGFGDILITTRRTDLGQLGTVHRIPPLDLHDASSVLLLYAEGRQPEDRDEEHALHIAKVLQCVPLAIRHCGCLTSSQNSRLSQYIVDFDELMTELVLPEEFGDVDDTFNLNEAKPILGTFHLSYDQVQRDSPDAAAVLQVLANWDPTDFSLAMLERCLEAHKHWDDAGNAVVQHIPGMRSWMIELPSKAQGYGLRRLIRKLVTYSLVFPRREEGHYFLHPVRLNLEILWLN